MISELLLALQSLLATWLKQKLGILYPYWVWQKLGAREGNLLCWWAANALPAEQIPHP